MTVGDLIDTVRPADPVSPDDTVARAVRVLRARGLPAVPVASAGRLIGLVTEGELLALAAAAAEPREAARSLLVAQAMRPLGLVANTRDSLLQVVREIQWSSPPAVPVVAADGRYLGMLLPRDALAALSGEPLVPPIAGLATVRGIYLTTGAHRAGASDLGLASTGAALMAINLASYGIFSLLLTGAGRLASGSGYAEAGELAGGVALVGALVAWALQVAVFLLLLRMSPLTRIHGAEHMVVRAIEEGEDLTLEKVRQMPRVHPRCGTNLMALLILLFIAVQFVLSVGNTVDEADRSIALFAVVVIVLVSWRRLGARLQQWVTTRRPSTAQLGRAIEVATSLLDDIRARPGARVRLSRRIWNTGFPQVVAGFLVTGAVAKYLVLAWELLRG